MTAVDQVRAAVDEAWLAHVAPLIPAGQPSFDTHVHLGADWADGAAQTPERYLAQMEAADVARAFCFPFAAEHRRGYGARNDMIIEPMSAKITTAIPRRTRNTRPTIRAATFI